MNPENDNRPGDGEPATGAVSEADAPALPNAGGDTTAFNFVPERSDVANAATSDKKLPLPLTPSGYGVAVTSLESPSSLTPPRPSVAATLPPLVVELLRPSTPQLRIAPEVTPAFDPTQLKLAPEADVGRVENFAPRIEAHLPRSDRAENVAATTEPISSKAQLANQLLPVPEEQRIAVPLAPLKIDQAVESRIADAGRPPHTTPVQGAEPKSVLAHLKSAVKIAAFAAAAYLALIALLIFAYRFVNPPMSSLMIQQWISGQGIQQSWANIEDISPHVVRAVLLSEDGRFCDHTGVDFDAMQDAIERAGEGPPRGASTISMQVTKNLFLWPSKSYVRKAIEIPLTWAMELVWPKRRIMEIYLNIAEWGPGIFGVEAASQFHFQKSARRLNEREAAQLAVSLPNPYMRDAGDPGPKTRRLASDIQSRMRNAYASQTTCVLTRGAGR